jgi:hypothetical protein
MVKMVGRLGGAALLLAVGCFCLPHPASAVDPIGQFSISGRVGVAGIRMGAINDGISRSNRLLASQAESEDWAVPDRIHSAFEFNGDASYDITPWIRLGLVYGSISGKTSVDYVQRIEVRPTTKMIVPRACYRLPLRLLDNLALRAFAGVVFLGSPKVDIEHENTSPNAPRLETIAIKNSGKGVTGGITGELTLSERFTLTFEGGYRQAKAGFDSGSYAITKLRDPGGNDDDDVLLNDRDPSQTSYLWGFMDGWNEAGDQEEEPRVFGNTDADFSGGYLQAGLRVYIF